jgi:hypothetical protein
LLEEFGIYERGGSRIFTLLDVHGMWNLKRFSGRICKLGCLLLAEYYERPVGGIWR